MSANKMQNSGKIQEKEVAESQEAPRFDDLLDLIAAFENPSEDLEAYLDTLEEVPEADFQAETRRLRAEWAAMPREEKQRHRVGEAVRERLLILGMRQAELARRLEKDRSWVTRLVQGRENVTLGTLSQLAEVLECDERDLVRPIVEKTEHAVLQQFVRLELPASQRTIAPTPALLRHLPKLLKFGGSRVEADETYIGAVSASTFDGSTFPDAVRDAA